MIEWSEKGKKKKKKQRAETSEWSALWEVINSNWMQSVTLLLTKWNVRSKDNVQANELHSKLKTNTLKPNGSHIRKYDRRKTKKKQSKDYESIYFQNEDKHN